MKWIIKSVSNGSTSNFFIGKEVDMSRPVKYVYYKNKYMGISFFIVNSIHNYYVCGAEIEEAEYL